ncbi:MAG: 50S ribosomal protein L17 [Deltaproteobacteria bacterium]|nr:50S ribosomal protein L17 [Deltaproteobacteria bacterium]
MRHRKAGLKLNRTSSHRNAMFRNMVTSLFKHERICTTDAKAKELRRWADNLITLAKRGDLHARRQALAIVREKDVVHKLFDEVAGRFTDISGGYTRIVKLGRRPGDAAPVSLIELVSPETEKKKRSKKKKTKAPAVKKQPVAKKETEAADKKKSKAEAKETGKAAKGEKTKPESTEDVPPEKETEGKETAEPEKSPDSEEKKKKGSTENKVDDSAKSENKEKTSSKAKK